MIRIRSVYAAALLAGASLLAAANSEACTGIRLIAEDGSVVHARTLEFAIDIKSAVTMIPRGYARTGTTPDGKEGLKWNAKYASVGMNGLGIPILFDGFNERGLAAALFYFPTSAGYMPYAAKDADSTIAPWELGSWILENFATIEEVKANIGKIVVLAVVYGG
jgi:choloylglycine hydrolase